MTTAPADQRIKLSCQCGACRLPFAYVQNGTLVILSRHNSTSHYNVLTLEQVKQMLEEAAATV